MAAGSDTLTSHLLSPQLHCTISTIAPTVLYAIQYSTANPPTPQPPPPQNPPGPPLPASIRIVYKCPYR